MSRHFHLFLAQVWIVSSTMQTAEPSKNATLINSIEGIVSPIHVGDGASEMIKLLDIWLNW